MEPRYQMFEFSAYISIDQMASWVEVLAETGNSHIPGLP